MNLKVIRNGLSSKKKKWHNLDILEYPCGCRAKITGRANTLPNGLLLPSCRLHVEQIYEFERARIAIKESEIQQEKSVKQ